MDRLAWSGRRGSPVSIDSAVTPDPTSRMGSLQCRRRVTEWTLGSPLPGVSIWATICRGDSSIQAGERRGRSRAFAAEPRRTTLIRLALACHA
jgi:hypothetical protein